MALQAFRQDGTEARFDPGREPARYVRQQDLHDLAELAAGVAP